MGEPLEPATDRSTTRLVRDTCERKKKRHWCTYSSFFFGRHFMTLLLGCFGTTKKWQVTVTKGERKERWILWLLDVKKLSRHQDHSSSSCHWIIFNSVIITWLFKCFIWFDRFVDILCMSELTDWDGDPIPGEWNQLSHLLPWNFQVESCQEEF